MPNPVSAQTLGLGLRNDFAGTYRDRREDVRGRLADIMLLDVPSENDRELYGYWETTPSPAFLPDGQPITSKAFTGKNFTVVNFEWGRRIEWRRKDRLNDQLKGLDVQARKLGTKFSQLEEEQAMNLLRGTTDADVLPYTVLSPDGAAFFATTAAGANRFGVAGGNIQTGTGVVTASAIQTDYFGVDSRLRLLLDTEGKPLLGDSELNAKRIIYFNANNVEVFGKAFAQATNLEHRAGTSTTDTSTAAGVTNLILASGIKIELRAVSYITDNDWFVFLAGMEPRPLFSQRREAIRESFAEEANSDFARDLRIEYLQFIAHYGIGMNLPIGAIKVNNT